MKTLFYVLAIFSPVLCGAQHLISGTITDKGQRPLIGARVIIQGTYDGAVSNTSGTFSFKTNQKDSVVLLVQFMGYESKTKHLVLSGSETKTDIILKEKFNELNAVTITAGAFEAGDKKKANLLTSLDMVTTPGASGNVVNALQFLPGTSQNGESGKLFVRGGSSQESKTFIDGTLVHNPFNASAPNTAVRSRFNPFMFSGTVFSTGGFSAEYGDALSSVLLLETKGIQEEDQLDISILSVGLGLAGTKKWKKSALTASIDYSNLTPYMNLVPQDITWDKMPETTEAALSYRYKTKHGLFKCYGNYSASRFNLYQFNLNTEHDDFFKLKNQNLYFNTSYKASINEKWIMALQASYTNYNEDIFINNDHVIETTIGGHAKAKFTRSFSKQFKIKGGVELLSTSFQQVFESELLDVNHDFKNYQFGSFAEADWYLSKKLVMRLGLRADHSSLLNRTVISPRTSVAYQFNKANQVSLAYGSFYQTPENDFLLYANTLDYERSHQYMINYSYTKNRRSFRAEAYYKPYFNLVKFDQTMPFYSSDYYTNNGHGSAYGFDMFFRDKKNHQKRRLLDIVLIS